MKRREKKRIDYKVLNDTGTYTYRESASIHSDESSNSSEDTLVGSEPDNNVHQSNTLVETLDHNYTSNTINSSFDQMSKQLESLSFEPHLTAVPDETNQNPVERYPTVMADTSDVKVDIPPELGYVIEELYDFIDENPVESLIVVDDLDECCSRLEAFRTDIRNLVRGLGNPSTFSVNLTNLYEKTMYVIKDSIHRLKTKKVNIRAEEVNARVKTKSLDQSKREEEVIQKTNAANFLLNEVSRLINESTIVFSKLNNDEVGDEEILLRNDDLKQDLSKLYHLSTKFHNMLQVIPNEFPSRKAKVDKITTQYHTLMEKKTTYELDLKTQVKERDLIKQKSFQVSALNIKLEVFKGYNSELDIYSFQREFEKLYLRNTPKNVLPDYLKHNYLADPALGLVKHVECMEEIWTRLKKAYGDPKTMLHKKLNDVKNIGPLWKLRDSSRLVEGYAAITNAMTDLMSLTKRHKIDGKLYNGDALDIIYGILGDRIVTKWLDQQYRGAEDVEKEGEDLWKELILFLERQQKLEQEKSLIKHRVNGQRQNFDAAKSHWCGEYQEEAEEQFQSDDASYNPFSFEVKENNFDSDKYSKVIKKCAFCGESGHVETNGPRGSSVIQYYACQKFVEMTPAQRYQELRSKELCFQCLYPGANQGYGTHTNGSCQKEYTCKHPSHEKHPLKKHVLVCHEHRESEENKKLLNEYKQKFINNQSKLHQFSKDLKLSFLSHNVSVLKKTDNTTRDGDDDVITNNGIYMLQTIKVGAEEFTIFFDSGCSDMVCRFNSIKRLGGRALQEVEGPLPIGGVGNMELLSPHGVYQIRLPLHSGKNAVLSGICLDQITSTFPDYPLHGKILSDIHDAYKKVGGNPKKLPKIPKTIGGDVDFMIGTKYHRYLPVAVFSLPSGLTVYESPFVNASGGRGVIGGPHEVITEVDKLKKGNCQFSNYFLSEQLQLYEMGYKVNPDSKLLGIKVNKDYSCNALLESDIDEEDDISNSSCYSLVRKQKNFEAAENAASDISYRCIDCRDCSKCKNGERIESLSLREEVEQDLINKSVTIDMKSRSTVARLPLLGDPAVKLAPNKTQALAIYRSQLRRLNRCESDKKEVIAAEAKLQSLGFVDYVKNLPEEEQQRLKANTVQNYIPWSAVWNQNSISTPCRIVFNASLPTQSKLSLNDILAKGRNNLNKLVEIVIRWRTHKFAYHTDIQKMYNSVKLAEEHWCLQRYIWQPELDSKKIPMEKIIKTLIYGVKSSGNQAETGLRETAILQEDDHPEVNKIVQEDVYMDDCMSGEDSEELVLERADELSLVLSRGGFNLKGFVFSGKDPPESLSQDSESVKVAGIKWYPRSDKIQLDIGDLNFLKKKRGKKPDGETKSVPDVLTRRDCVRKVAEIYDLTGKVTPLTASMKADLRILINNQLGWDDKIPDELRGVWTNHFEMMQEIDKVKFNRAVVPPDACSLHMDTIDTGDASKNIACAAIYIRFKRSNGTRSCQLIFSRSKLLPEGISQPRAELIAANLNAHTGEVVRRSLKKFHESALKLTDSQIVLHWITNKELRLKEWVRNRVVEILRFTSPSMWKYVESSNMIADIGTRRGARIEDVLPESEWNKGFPWMKDDVNNLPVKSNTEVKLSSADMAKLQEELVLSNKVSVDLKKPDTEVYIASGWTLNQIAPDKIKERYTFSKYIYDPNKYGFHTALRVVGYIIKFISLCRKRVTSNAKCVTLNTCQKFSFELGEEELRSAANYYFRKATLEVKQFCKVESYAKLSFEKDDILYYKGRILSDQGILAISPLSTAMKDLAATTFCVPIVDRYSPLAYSIVNEVHWNDTVAKHRGVETVLRYVKKIAFVLEGRDLVKLFRKHCERCRYIEKRTIEVSMGPLSDHNLTVAPAFYVAQTDLCGPFSSYSPHNKRATIKIWLLVFCCATTATVSIKVMDAYSTTAFIQGFIRFACEVGYPKMLLIDEGSQLVKGCKIMNLCFQDIKRKLYCGMKVEFDTCPVGGHNFHGRVERKIRQIKDSLETTLHGDRLSLLQWETLGSQISNSINDLPIGIKGKVAELEHIDLITPNRLRLGRNNDRSPVGPMILSDQPNKFLESNEKIFQAWFEAWLITHVPNLMEQPKWFKDEYDISTGDVVLFLKQEGSFSGEYQFGMIVDVFAGKDGKIRTVNVRYRNSTEKTNRITRRSVRKLIMIHPVEELSLLKEIHAISTMADIKLKLNGQHG